MADPAFDDDAAAEREYLRRRFSGEDLDAPDYGDGDGWAVDPLAVLLRFAAAVAERGGPFKVTVLAMLQQAAEDVAKLENKS